MAKLSSLSRTVFRTFVYYYLFFGFICQLYDSIIPSPDVPRFPRIKREMKGILYSSATMRLILSIRFSDKDHTHAFFPPAFLHIPLYQSRPGRLSCSPPTYPPRKKSLLLLVWTMDMHELKWHMLRKLENEHNTCLRKLTTIPWRYSLYPLLLAFDFKPYGEL